MGEVAVDLHDKVDKHTEEVNRDRDLFDGGTDGLLHNGTSCLWAIIWGAKPFTASSGRGLWAFTLSSPSAGYVNRSEDESLPLLDEKRVEMVARNQGIRAKEGESATKLLTALLRKADEGAIGKLIVEAVILLSASKQADGGKVLRAAAQTYKVDTDAIALKVKQEFAAKATSREGKKPQAVSKQSQKRVA